MRSDEELTTAAIDFVLAMMASASTSNIKPLDWWERARTALETSAAVAESWPQMVSKYGAKVQVIALKSKTAHEIARLGQVVSKNEDFERLRYLAQRDALFITAMAQVTRDEQRNNEGGN